MFYLYILKSKKTGKFYIGKTENIERRITYHNSGYNRSTKSGIPWELVYTEKYFTRAEVVQRENEIKKKKSRKYIESMVEIGERPD